MISMLMAVGQNARSEGRLHDRRDTLSPLLEETLHTCRRLVCKIAKNRIVSLRLTIQSDYRYTSIHTNLWSLQIPIKELDKIPVNLVGQLGAIVAPESSTVRRLVRNGNKVEDLGSTLFRSDRAKVLELCSHFGRCGPGHIGGDNSGTTRSTMVKYGRNDLLNREGSHVVDLLIDLLGDIVGTGFAETIAIEGPGHTVGDLSSGTGDGNEFTDL